MTPITSRDLLEDERLAPLLPMLHAAWADGYLTIAELNGLSARLQELVDDECVPTLRGWLDPAQPPAAEEVAGLAAGIRRVLPDTPRGGGPTDLGLRLAGAVPDQVVEALRRIEAAVGPFGPTSVIDLVGRAPGPTLEPLPLAGDPPFDLAELRGILDGPHGGVRRRLHRVLARESFSYRYDLSIAEYRRQVTEWNRTLAEEGFGALGSPPGLGGGGDPGGFLAAFAALAHHDLSLLTKFGVQFGLFAGAVMRLGTETHHPLVAEAIRGDHPGCFAMTETGHGSNVAGLETTAEFVSETDEIEIHTPGPQARKDYIGSAARDGRTAVVFARLLVGELDHGIHAFVVPIRTEGGESRRGVRIGDDGPKAGLNGVDNGWLMFDRVRVPRSALLDRFARLDSDGTYHSDINSPARRFFTTLGTLVGGRVSVAAAAVSVAESALTIAVRYAFRRRQFSTDAGPETPLIEYRTHQRRLMTRLAATYAYRFAVADLARRYVDLEEEAGDTDHDRREFEGRAAGLKAFATWHALDTVSECRQACGGQGYLAENRLGILQSDVDVFTTFEGDNTVLAQLLAKALLTDYRSSFDDLTPGRLVRFLGDRIAGFVTQNIPVVGSVGGERTDPDVCLALLERRTRYLLEKLAGRVKVRIDQGMEAAEAFLDVQPHAVDLARAATEEAALRATLGVEVSDASPGEVVGDLAALFGLSCIERDMGSFVVSGLLTGNGAKEVRAGVIALSARLAADSRHLTAAFGIPDAVLGAPIAR